MISTPGQRVAGRRPVTPPVALVTGAGRGIGAATVRALVQQGWDVVATDRCADDPRVPYPLASRANLDDVATAAAASGPGRAVALPVDTTDATAVAAAIAHARDVFGGLDALVAAAGVVTGGAPLWELPPHLVAAALDVNLSGVVTLARAGVPALLERPPPRRGRFVALGSVTALPGEPGLAGCSAARAGVVGLVRSLAGELRGTGITANVVSPGGTDTPMLTEMYRLLGTGTPPPARPVQAADVAALIVHLLSPQGAAITGADLPVPGAGPDPAQP